MWQYKDEYDRQYAFWLWNPKNCCWVITAPSLSQSCSDIRLSYKSNIRASWMYLHNCSCFQEHLGMLLQSLMARCLALGGPGSIWKYFEALVMSARVSGSFACSFRTNFHFADVTNFIGKWDWQICSPWSVVTRLMTDSINSLLHLKVVEWCFLNLLTSICWHGHRFPVHHKFVTDKWFKAISCIVLNIWLMPWIVRLAGWECVL